MWTRSVVRPAIFVADDSRMKLTQCAPEIVTFCLPPLDADSCTFLIGDIEPHEPIIKMVRRRDRRSLANRNHFIPTASIVLPDWYVFARIGPAGVANVAPANAGLCVAARSRRKLLDSHAVVS